MATKKWFGTWPANCDLCRTPLKGVPNFVDGATKMGPWALMCPMCHVLNGRGIGLGKGQRYDSKDLKKIEG